LSSSKSKRSYGIGLIKYCIKKDSIISKMSKEVWNKVYKSDSTFFGQEPSNFALLCFNYMKANDVKKVLELGAGHGRDTTFFASSGIEEVQALDYSTAAVEILDKIAQEKKLSIKSQVFDVRKKPLPFADGYFDAVYSHMLLNMRFSLHELHFIFSEIRRVLIKPKKRFEFLFCQKS
jgi:SAM-dependent methyltransferase